MTLACPALARRAPAVSLALAGYRARIGSAPGLARTALKLRSAAFRAGAMDRDAHDDQCLHGLVESPGGAAVLAFRLTLIETPAELPACYTGQDYDLAPLMAARGPFLELGRFCQSGTAGPDALRLGWAAIGAAAEQAGVRMIFGCSSFPGADPQRHAAALAWLGAHRLGPAGLRPRRKSADAVELPRAAADPAGLPRLMRSYLNLGGWVGDHAVRDTDLDRLHIFTALNINAIPPRRKARVRALAQMARPLDLANAAP
ncbi:GNAT family N-acyltransferase [Marivita sp. GX14005]|uniref:GNAT family N-acyltransferase n=1 Tax=Marivita sp. GX14005 TaxID=2942276 RepID=UPI00201955C1|nr:GNAT family N-acyltransferase [Marivita sp. GX14005]MCL3882825.1 GNAT family N-acetyltransferase [Marivita sp. GX14005]